MTKRLAVIIIVGVIAIIATYLLTKPPSEEPFPEQFKASAGSTAPGVTAAGSVSGSTGSGAPDSTVSTSIAGQSGSTASTPLATSNTAAAPGTTASQVPSQNLVDGVKNAIAQALSIPEATPNSSQASPDFSEGTTAVMPSVIDATDRNSALLQARALAGRRDPFAPVGATKPFPRARKMEFPVPKSLVNSGTKSATETLDDHDSLPPEPGDKTALNLVPDTVPVPPPPGISSDELPPPPDKPLLVKKLRLNGIVGDRAILAFNDRNYSRDNGWRPYITLGAGDRFDSIRVVSVGEESVVIEEEGKKSTLQIPPIR